MSLIHILKSLKKKPEYALNTVCIDAQKLLENLNYLQSGKPTDAIFPVLKSNAYGHGLKEISSILQSTNVPYICVDSYPEYQIVKTYARKKSLIMGETLPDNYAYYDPNRVALAVYNIHTLHALIATGKKRTIHLFLNTGMNREGVQTQELKPFLDLLATAPQITLEGVMSHFANADELDSSLCEVQITNFKTMYATIEQKFGPILYHHIGNSAGRAKITDPFFNARRTGIALYGYSPLSANDPHTTLFAPLQPVLSVISTVVALQKLEAGEIVSYGGKWTSEKSKQITATIPFGYYEGLSRKLLNNRSVKRKEQYLPVIGTICMNLSCLDTGGYDVHLGDAVEIIGTDAAAPNSIYQFAQKTGTIPYEVLTKLNEKIRRKII